ncbi:T9SS type A sorting domain-containing protein, partial [Flavicella sp.]
VNSLPDDVAILGKEKVCANQIDVLYKVSNVNEFYSYQWQCTNGEIVEGRNTSECIINWDNTPGVIGTVSLEQTIDSTGCSKITELPIEVSEYSAPNATSIIRKPNTNILIAKDESAGLLFQWGYDSKNSDDSVTILGANLRYVLVSPELNFNEFRYWLKTSFENEDNTSCETYTYFNPDTDGTIAAPKVEELLIYPNPANGTIYFENLNLKNSEVKVYATNGRLINYFIDNQSTITLDKSTPPGIYLIRVRESGNVINKKIILK